MKDNFKGWTTVYGFTFKQAVRTTGFKVVTALVAILIIAAIILANVLSAKPDKDNNIAASPINTVYVLDSSGLQPTDFKEMVKMVSEERFQHIEFITAASRSRDEVIKSASLESTQAIAVIITSKESGYQIEVAIPYNSTIKKRQASELLEAMASGFQSNKLMQVGLSVEQLNTALKPVSTSFSEIGKNTNWITQLIKIIAPMVFGLMLYLMLLLHGQTISKSVSTEKTSKLMETLLTSVRPYALITGKVLAITSVAIVQFLTWIASAFAGLYGGNAIAKSIYPDYENSVISIINFLKDNIGETAMTVPAVIMAVVFFGIGFLFYCMLAGLAGSVVSKPEDVASAQGISQFPVIISFLVCYLAPISGNEKILTAIRYIPFTAPFSVPVDLITGTIGLREGIIALALLSFFSFLMIALSARTYKGLVLYTGQKLNIKTIGNIIKGSGQYGNM
jgi:ABC-2 type transport system permease protein